MSGGRAIARQAVAPTSAHGCAASSAATAHTAACNVERAPAPAALAALAPAGRETREPRYARTLVRWIALQFGLMSATFALNHGTVSAILALQSSQLGEALGGAASATLYFSWVSSSFLAPAYMPSLGSPRRALLCGMLAYCCYCAANLLAAWPAVHSARGVLAVGGAVLGGMGAGPLFVGESVYFAAMAESLSAARCDGDGGIRARAQLSGSFAVIYCGLEMSLKLLAGSIAGVTLYTSYFSAAFAASLAAALFLSDPPASAQRAVASAAGRPRVRSQLLAVLHLLRSPRASCMLVAFNLTFGFATGIESTIILARGVGKSTLTPSSIGPASAVLTLTSSLFAWPLSQLAEGIPGEGRIARATRRYGRGYVGALSGPCAWLVVAVLLLSVGTNDEDSPLITHSWSTLIALQMLMGTGRSTYESIGVAVIAEFFSDEDVEVAMATRMIFNGLGGSASFFLLPKLSSFAASAAFGLLALLAAVTFSFAVAIPPARARTGFTQRSSTASDADGLWRGRVGTTAASSAHEGTTERALDEPVHTAAVIVGVTSEKPESSIMQKGLQRSDALPP
ncbi:hypothetical protein AB1Y20_015215 [Prymnesium parvum]|uniref:Uncharacterized protein n=1 Tax=Prymnesium parvum TaxID=97485 RepID=A0AB34JXW2_PRYPA